MTTTILPGFSLGAMIDAGLRAESDDAWHLPEPCPACGAAAAKRKQCPECKGEGQLWRWHASSLARCPRGLILRRAGLAPDETPRSGKMTFALGHAIHASLERWAVAYAAVEPRFELVGSEIGADHPDLPLRAKADLVFRWEGILCLGEAKSEKQGASKWRAQDAEKNGYDFPVKWDHWLQMTCQALCLEPLLGEPITIGRALYVQKNDWFVDSVPVDLDDAFMRATVLEKVANLEHLWQRYRTQGELPPAIDLKSGDAWECSQRQPSERDGEGDPRGRWCSSRSVCFARR